jgi:hypothetical protein
MKQSRFLAFLLLAFCATGLSACSKHGKERRGLAPEALSACEGKKSGDSCTVKMGDREMAGACASHPSDAGESQLACRPVHPAGEKRPR